jgi:hypothetical protein
MRRILSIAGLVLGAGLALNGQAADKELVATITGPTMSGGIVTALAWDGGTLIIQTAAMEEGSITPRYFTVPGPRMEVQRLKSAPAGIGKYWKLKSSRTSPTGLGKIVVASDSKVPMYGIADQAKRFRDVMDMGGAVVMHELRLGELVLHRRRDVEPYDGEVWSWSPPELNRIAYVDEKGDLWIAGADGRGAERLLKGKFTLPAWSDDGRVLGFAESKENGTKWDISVVHLPERFRR